MPDDDFSDDTDHDADGDSNVRRMRDKIKAQDAELKTAREAADKVQVMERRLAFAEAGLGDSPMREYFVKGYDGDTSPEAIRAAATAAGLPLLGEASSTPAPDRTADVAAHTAMNQAAGGGTSDGDRNAAYHAALGKATTSDEILAVCREFGVPVAEDYQ